MTFNEALGFTVNQYLFAHRITREELGKLLGVSRTVAGKKIRGQVGWTAEDVAVVAARFGISVDSLLPRRSEDVAAGSVPAAFVPPVGLEPTTFGLKVRSSDQLS